MDRTKFLPDVFKEIKISELHQGHFIINLGEVLEVDELTDTFTAVIVRMNQKQVFTFRKDDILLIKNS